MEFLFLFGLALFIYLSFNNSAASFLLSRISSYFFWKKNKKSHVIFIDEPTLRLEEKKRLALPKPKN